MIEKMSLEELREYAREQRDELIKAEPVLIEAEYCSEVIRTIYSVFMDDYEYQEPPRWDVGDMCALRWVYGYKRIIRLVDMMADYGFRIIKAVEKYEERTSI